MRQKAVFATICTVFLLTPPALPRAAEYGTANEATTMLDRAVAAVKEDKAKALDTFNKGEGDFRDRDLYVFCANVSDGILTAHPALKGEELKDIKGKKGYPLGQEIMRKAREGKINKVTTRTRHSRNTRFTRRWETRSAALAITNEPVSLKAGSSSRLASDDLLQKIRPNRNLAGKRTSVSSYHQH